MIKLLEHPELVREIERQINSGRTIELKLIVKDDAKIINLSTISRKKTFSKKINNCE